MHNKKWVFDTVVLSNFLISDAAYILEKRYNGHGVITSAVYDEISAGMLHIQSLNYTNKLIKNRIFTVCNLTGHEYTCFREMITFLGKGEASCIAYAKDKQHTIIATDDRTARKQCVQMNIPVTGTIGILKASVQDGWLDLKQADDILARMIASGFYSPVNSIAEIL